MPSQREAHCISPHLNAHNVFYSMIFAYVTTSMDRWTNRWHARYDVIGDWKILCSGISRVEWTWGVCWAWLSTEEEFGQKKDWECCVVL